MTPTKLRDLLAVLLLTGVVVHLMLQLVYDDLPPLPTLAGTSLALVAAGEAAFAYSLRGRLRDQPHTVQPHTAVRALALAKASSLLGALMAGGWLAVLAYVVPVRDEFAVAGSDTTSALVGFVSATALVAAGLWLEHTLRTPDDPEQDRNDDHAARDW